MRVARSQRVNLLGRWGAAAAIAALLALGACSLLLDRNTTECTTNADCLRFAVQPFCQAGACVKTLPPCFLGTPGDAGNFLNQCTTATCFSFNDCQRLDLCDGAAPPPPIAPPSQPAVSTPLAEAGTIPNCASEPMGPGGLVYVTGSSNFPTLLKKVAPYILAGAGPAVIYQTTNSCTGAARIFSDAGTISDPPDGGKNYAEYYNSSGTPETCLLGPGGHSVDVGESDVYSTTCNSQYSTSSGVYNDHTGPAQGMAFVVNAASSQFSISQSAAVEVLGLGGDDGRASPWTNPNRYYIRNKNTGTQQMIALQIGVPAAQFWGVDQGSAQNVHDQLASLAPDEAEQAIGIISVDVYDSDRTNLKVLAFKAAGQECGYLPDSTSASFDKQNVRDGHYPIWGPLHFFTSTNNNNSMAALQFVGFFAEEPTIAGLLDAFISASLVPNCAMAVFRPGNEELGALAPVDPTSVSSCACYFLSQTMSTPPAECTSCSKDSMCPASRPACNFGFCEVH